MEILILGVVCVSPNRFLYIELVLPLPLSLEVNYISVRTSSASMAYKVQISERLKEPLHPENLTGIHDGVILFVMLKNSSRL
jgi:hypothetical protein